MSIPEFVDQLQSKYDTALANKTLFFTPTTICHSKSASGIQFEVRCITSLSAKPTGNQHHPDALKKPEDPFSPPYIPDLFVCEFNLGRNDDSIVEEDSSYVVLLNKFCVVPRHFLLVTRPFKSQNSPPSPTDLCAIRLILEQASSREPQNEWIAFYNSGPESGASQPHKHFQFIPIKQGSSPFGKLIEQCAPAREGEIFSISGLSYSHFVVLLPNLFSSSTGSRLEEIEMTLGKLFMGLLDSMIDRLRHLPPSPSTSKPDRSKDKILSYNFVMTQKYMIIVPRSKEIFKDLHQENNSGHQCEISINSLGVGAGMILVKNLDSLERLGKIGLDNLLAAVTFPVLKENVIDPCSQG